MTSRPKSKIEKYTIHSTRQDGIGRIWWARPPWGMYRDFPSWKEAADYLSLRHRLSRHENRRS